MNAAASETMLTFSIRDWFAWKPGRDTRASWLTPGAAQSWQAAKAQDPDWATKPVAALPMMLRRRMSAFDQKVVGAALTLPAAGAVRYVFASRHGEFATTLRILEDLYQRALPSPADFSLSVHHALAGLLSIQAGNKAGHTTVCAGRDTFGYGLLEAVTACAERPDQPALLVAYDEPLPGVYSDFQGPDEAELPLVVVLEIAADGTMFERFGLQVEPKEVGTAAAVTAEIPLGQGFLDFFLSDLTKGVLAGDTLNWVIHRVSGH